MNLPIYQVDAFTDKLFGGNPAAVCPLTEWLDEEKNLRTITGLYFPADPGIHFISCFIRDEYDFMVFVHSGTQSTFLF